MVPPVAAGASQAGLTRRHLVAELAQVVGAPHEARFIVDEAVGCPPFSGPLTPATVASARAMAARRAAGEPLQYVFGHWSFRTLDLLVDRRVLIPRPETEQVVEVALAEARRLRAERARTGDVDAAVTRAGTRDGGGLVSVDVGTGSGAIALSLATELRREVLAEVWGVDASTDALAVASSNHDAVQALVRDLVPVTLVRGEWLDPLPERLRGRVDLVVSNPPYVSEDEWHALPPVVRAEPRQALVAGPAGDGTPGLAGVEAVLVESLDWLDRPGAAVVELAPHQADAAARLARDLGYVHVRTEPDLAGRSRTLVVRTAAST